MWAYNACKNPADTVEFFHKSKEVYVALTRLEKIWQDASYSLENGILAEFDNKLDKAKSLRIAQVAEVYRALPADGQKEAVFLGTITVRRPAIDVLGRPLGLPRAISGHNNYFLWGPQGHDGSVVIRLSGRLEDLLKLYASCTDAGVTGNPWAMPYENGKTLWVCRGRQPPMDKAWLSFRHYG